MKIWVWKLNINPNLLQYVLYSQEILVVLAYFQAVIFRHAKWWLIFNFLHFSSSVFILKKKKFPVTCKPKVSNDVIFPKLLPVHAMVFLSFLLKTIWNSWFHYYSLFMQLQLFTTFPWANSLNNPTLPNFTWQSFLSPPYFVPSERYL